MSTSPDPKIVLGQLLVMRAQLDLAIALLEGPAPDEGCPHPEEKRLDCSTPGGPPTFYCRVCEQEIAGVV